MSVAVADSAAAKGRGPAVPGSPQAAKSGALGMTVFVIVLGFFFAAGLIIYLVARTGGLGHIVTSGTGVERVEFPVWFWPSTLVILIASVVLHGGFVAARADRAPRALRSLRATGALGLLFLALQTPGLVQLVSEHRAFAEQHVLIYALVIFLVTLHAAHVLGGLGYLGALLRGAGARPLNAQRAPTLKALVIYWHFLAGVWLVMFNTFLLVG